MVCELNYRFKFFYIPAKNIKEYLDISFKRLVRNTFVCICGSEVFILWGKYKRKILPQNRELHIKRVRCTKCKKTHAILPTFLFGQVRHDNQTIAPYFQQFTQKQTSIMECLAQSYNLPEAPEDDTTLYRWFNRFIARCKTLLPLLKKELIQLDPKTNLKEFGDIFLGQGMLSPNSICNSAMFISENLLRESTQLLQMKSSLTPLTFLNYFCWQKTGKALLAPLPPKPQ